MPATGPHSERPQEPARAQRFNKAHNVEDRLRNGLPPVALAGVAALLTQLETMQTLPGVSLIPLYRGGGSCLPPHFNLPEQCLGRIRSYPSIPVRAVHCNVWPKPGHQI